MSDIEYDTFARASDWPKSRPVIPVGSEAREPERTFWICEEHAEENAGECLCGLTPYVPRAVADDLRAALKAAQGTDHKRVEPETRREANPLRKHYPIRLAAPAIPAVRCPNCRGEGRYREGTIGGQTVGMEPSGRVHVCPDCQGTGHERDPLLQGEPLNEATDLIPQGTGHERVIPATDLIAKLHAWIEGRERDVWMTDAQQEAAQDVLDDLAARLDEYTTEAPSGTMER